MKNQIIGTDIKIDRNKATNKKGKTKAILITAVGLCVVFIGFIAFKSVALWFDYNRIVYRPLDINIQTPKISIEERPLLNPVIEVMAYPVEVENDIEQYICDTFGTYECQVAIAVMRAESKGNAEAWNYNTNGTLDIGLWQINEINWDTCNMTMKDLLDPYKNTDCAKIMYDRSDESFSPWVAFWTGSFKEEL